MAWMVNGQNTPKATRKIFISRVAPNTTTASGRIAITGTVLRNSITGMTLG